MLSIAPDIIQVFQIVCSVIEVLHTESDHEAASNKQPTTKCHVRKQAGPSHQ